MHRAISPLRELGAYEALWAKEGTSFESLAGLFCGSPGQLPSDLVSEREADETAAQVIALAERRGLARFEVCVHHAPDYPSRLRDARHPVELLYHRGSWSLTALPAIAVVGTRKPSPEGLKRTRRLVRELVEAGFAIVSGLAEGIDTAAHRAALEAGGRSIAVLGTPLSEVYPRLNRGLQDQLGAEHLVVSQVPFKRYFAQGMPANQRFFAERNATMSALTEASVIVEATDSSGTLIQARAALEQGRALFILESAFQDTSLTWPQMFAARGAIRVTRTEDILDRMKRPQPR